MSAMRNDRRSSASGTAAEPLADDAVDDRVDNRLQVVPRPVVAEHDASQRGAVDRSVVARMGGRTGGP